MLRKKGTANLEKLNTTLKYARINERILKTKKKEIHYTIPRTCERGID